MQREVLVGITIIHLDLGPRLPQRNVSKKGNLFLVCLLILWYIHVHTMLLITDDYTLSFMAN